MTAALRKPVISACILLSVALVAYAYVYYIGRQAESALEQGREMLGVSEGSLLQSTHARRSLKDVVLAIQALRRSVSLNPKLARAHTNLAWAYIKGAEQDSEFRGLASTEIQQALALDPNSAEAHAVAAYIALHDRSPNRAGAAREIARAVELNPTEESYRDLQKSIIQAQ